MAFVPGKVARRTTGGVSRRNSALAPWLLLASLLHCLLDRRTQAQSVSGVRSTYNVYDPAGHDYELAGLYCATWDSDQSYAWRSEYKWTAYCADGGPSMGRGLCGQCLQVTNEDTQDSIVVRILDQCSNGGLDLETDAFNAIDSDGQGYNNGHLTVDIQFVDC